MEREIDIIKKIHSEYFEYMIDGNMNKVSELFHYPSSFKGFSDNLMTAMNKEELINIYRNLIDAAPEAESITMKDTKFFKLRDNTYTIIMNYSQHKDDNEVFSGKACYVFSKINNKWKICAVL
tara:strand:+ start:41 stop:409 length:369 start_codon:yes stop_codon:yes gene_type:complete